MTQVGDADHPPESIGAIPLRRAASFRRVLRQNHSLALIDACPLRRACTIHLLRAHRFKAAQPFADVAALLAYGSTRPYRFAGVIICTGMHSVTEAALRDQLQLVVNGLGPVPLVVMSDLDSSEEMVAAFREGARGYIPTSLEPHLVVEAIRMVLADVPFVPAEALLRLRRQSRHEPEVPCLDQLSSEDRQSWSPRHLAILRLLAQGRPNKEIARALALNESTIKVHIRLIIRKLGVTNRTQAALSARKLGTSFTPDGALTAAAGPIGLTLTQRRSAREVSGTLQPAPPFTVVSGDRAGARGGANHAPRH